MLLTRRALLVASLSSLGRSAKAAPAPRKATSPPVEANLRHIMPAPAGNETGDSWANAASIWRLNDMIAAAGPGGTVNVRGDAGSYSFTDNRVTINNGGQVGSPVTVIGVDQMLASMKATIVGS